MNPLGGMLVVLNLLGAMLAPAQAAEGWLQPQTLSQAGTFNDRPDLATNSPGVAALVWSESADARTPRNRVRVSTRMPGGTWGASEQLSGAGEAEGAAVGVDPQGRITAVWTEGNIMHWADKAPGQPWTAGQAIPDGATGGKPDLFIASDGTATAVWQVGYIDASVIKTARRPLGGAWSAVETISPSWSYRAHVEGDTAGDVTVSYTHDGAGGSQRFIYAVDRPNSGPWGTPVPIAGPLLADNVKDLVVAPNSGAATVVWQNGLLSAPLAARTRSGTATWATAPTVPISGNTAGRLDLEELDRAAVDGTGLVTVVWIAGNKVLTAYRDESTGTWAAPVTPMAIDSGDGTPMFGPLTVASNAFGRALAVWGGNGGGERYALRGPGAGVPWSTPQPIDGVPDGALPLDLAIDDTGRTTFVWGMNEGFNVQALAVSTYGNAVGPPSTTTTTLPGGEAVGNTIAGGIASSVAETRRFVTRLAKNSSIQVTVPDVPAPGYLRVNLFGPLESPIKGRRIARGVKLVKKAGRVRVTLQTTLPGRKILKRVFMDLAQNPSVQGLDLRVDVVFRPSAGGNKHGSAVATAPL